MPRRSGILAGTAVFLLLAVSSIPASAHNRRGSENTSGIPIPSLTHGQMAVIADYRGEILDLAARQSRTDETFRRLLNFGTIQHTYCLWGLVPGSLRDEDSPFNECSHAYLSAAQALLVHMRDIAPDKAPADALISRIDAAMVRNRASFVLCQFSAEPFNTAAVIYPEWRQVPFHPASILAFTGLALTLTTGTLALTSNRRTRPTSGVDKSGRTT